MYIRKLKNTDFSIIQLLEQFKNENLNISNYNFKILCHSYHIVLVIEDQQQIICCGTILIETKLLHNIGKVGHIEDITHSLYRGQGLENKLFNHWYLW